MSGIRIYDNIFVVAKTAGVSINYLEKKAGLSTGSLCKWNTVSPSVKSLKKVADVLGVPIGTLVDGPLCDEGTIEHGGERDGR